MLCQKCKKREATVHREETVGGKKCEFHLCAECAAYTYGEFEDNVQGAIMAGLLGERVPQDKKCPACGMRWSDYEKTGLLGCPSCYDVFHAELLPHIARIQGKTTHKGKGGGVYTSEHDLRMQLSSLQDELEGALRSGNYIKATHINDRLNRIKNKLAGKFND